MVALAVQEMVEVGSEKVVGLEEALAEVLEKLEKVEGGLEEAGTETEAQKETSQ